ncbi:MAG: winged helix-turn-helix transcriptional regulator [Theionarchaea archaeon]|nr:winged helix-turn-helix transcriptional regulator [Theionarchaea archaeon]
MKDPAKKERVMLQYFNIVNAIREDPFISLSEMSSQINVSRNTISRHLKKMYADRILTGPQISVKPHRNCTRYLYLLQVSSPYEIFQELKTLPHVKNLTISFGEWNINMLTDQMMDFSALKGFQKMIFAGKRYDIFSPPTKYATWEQSFKEIRQELEGCTPTVEKRNIRVLSELHWGEQEWELYRAIRLNVRQDIRPVLREHCISYETYQRWKKTLLDHCSAHTGFYPEGLDSNLSLYALFRTDFTQAVMGLFSLFLTTPFFADLDEHILAVVRIPFSLRGYMNNLIDGMREKGIIEDAHYAVELFT